jgi:hypothetical protein
MALMPILASYLGHVHPAETYWYLTGVPQLMSIACDSFRDMVVGEVFFDEQPD